MPCTSTSSRTYSGRTDFLRRGELTAEALSGLQVIPGKAKPPPPVGDFSYVEVVGCFTPGPENTWLLTNASEPVSLVAQPDAKTKSARSPSRHAGIPAARRHGVQSRGAQGPQDVRQRLVDQTAWGTADDDQLSGDDRAQLRELMKGQSGSRSVLFSLSFTAVVGAAQSTDSSTTTVWQGVYTEAQAARGEAEYTTHCANCHRDDLSGYNDILKGARFMEKNRESTLHLFFEKTKTTMPRGRAGDADRQSVRRHRELRAEGQRISGRCRRSFASRICRRFRSIGKDGPEQVPDFSLVRVVGCLTTNASDGAWMLTHSTDPVRTGNPQPATGEREAAEAWPLGPQTYRLLVSAAYAPATSQRAQSRGSRISHPPPD